METERWGMDGKKVPRVLFGGREGVFCAAGVREAGVRFAVSSLDMLQI
jgi:hypothetical protein